MHHKTGLKDQLQREATEVHSLLKIGRLRLKEKETKYSSRMESTNKRPAEAPAAPAATSTKQARRNKHSDRVVVEVGGQPFVTTRTTLKANSTYFASLFFGIMD